MRGRSRGWKEKWSESERKSVERTGRSRERAEASGAAQEREESK